MKGICRLCKQYRDLQLSHILPAFVFKWLKRDGFIRHSAQINKRTQDGAKEQWLCSECEQLFCGWETKFFNSIFHPLCYGDMLPTISYGDWLLKFSASVSWRSLLYVREQARLTHFSTDQLRKADRALETWAKVLRGEREHPGEFEQHLIPFGPIKGHGGIEFPPNINRYLLRTVEIDAGCSRSTAFVFSKLGRIGIVGFIQSKRPDHWSGTKVRLRGGRMTPRRYTLPAQFGNYLADRARRLWKALEGMSDPQSEKVNATIRANMDRFANSQLLRAMEHDVHLFGNAAFPKRNKQT
jgi:hypothetical protein